MHGVPKTEKAGFTFIELLVVVVVIVILAGAVFRLIGTIEASREKADTQAILAKVALALEAYKGIYGKYPPVPYYNDEKAKHRGQLMRFEYPLFDDFYYPEFDDAAVELIVAADGNETIDWKDVEGAKSHGIFTFGLCSFFLPRYQLASEGGIGWFGIKNATSSGTVGDSDAASWDEDAHVFGQWYQFNKRRADSMVGDSTRDLNAVRRIIPYLGGSVAANGKVNLKGSIVQVANGEQMDFRHVKGKTLPGIPICRATIKDGYARGNSNLGDHDLRYYSRPPYESYELRSAGPDDRTIGDIRGDGSVIKAGDAETEDDIVVGG